MKDSTLYRLIALAIGLTGFGFLVWADYRVAIGVFLIFWGHGVADEASIAKAREVARGRR